jgi:hypothetical protein
MFRLCCPLPCRSVSVAPPSRRGLPVGDREALLNPDPADRLIINGTYHEQRFSLVIPIN